MHLGRVLKLFFIVWMLYTNFSVDAVEYSWAAKFPDVVAVIDGHKISRNEAVAILERSVDISKVNSSNASMLLRTALEEEFCRIVLRKKLQNDGFSPSQKQTLDFLLVEQSLRPQALSPVDRVKLEHLSKNENLQLRVALQLSLAKKSPLEFRVSDEEVERFYRNHQTEYMKPAVENSAIVQVEKSKNGRRELERLLAYMQQGGSFAKGVEQCKLKLPYATMSGDMLRESSAKLKSGEVSDILVLTDSLALVYVESRQKASYYSLEEVKKYIRIQLESALAAQKLQKILEQSLSSIDIEYL